MNYTLRVITALIILEKSPFIQNEYSLQYGRKREEREEEFSPRPRKLTCWGECIALRALKLKFLKQTMLSFHNTGFIYLVLLLLFFFCDGSFVEVF